MSQKKQKRNPNSPASKRARREFLRATVAGVGVTGLAMAGWLPIAAQATPRLRPPGAIDEKEYLASCIKCGQCVQVCPVEALVLADVDDGFGIGAPYLDARAQACDFSCDAVQCVLACPTGALSHDIDKKEQVTMALAKLTKPENCLARKGLGFKGKARGEDFEGLHRYLEVDRWNPIKVADHEYDLEICDLCVRECPIKGAIELVPMGDGKGMTPVIKEACVGCGMCEMMCPVEPTCIEMDVDAQAKAGAA
ncbi:4Fe-4S dicluster domain-containing protein [Terasakiella sp. A23]|uniref:4Fe-4S dicluster domain-containing protein n=1 Tax=Terasakiella sp. FCG-A23 TaxID=3080561 RepID=UPI002952DFC9|nr:4Fe-4S dicluster domain-containing protein [Terasakiella sp. A23]MDV7341064.1 4Fe-4S dicluster domain-containing protein [Terasakiella sp. A23]